MTLAGRVLISFYFSSAIAHDFDHSRKNIEPREWSSVDLFRYVVVDKDAVSFKHARRICQKTGAQLPVISNQLDNIMLQHAIKVQDECDLSQGLWLGISDALNEGVWTSVYTGERIAFSVWDVGRPLRKDMGAKKDCAVVMYRETEYTGIRGFWVDVSCTSKRKVVCEAPPPLATVSGTSTEAYTTTENCTSNRTFCGQSQPTSDFYPTATVTTKESTPVSPSRTQDIGLDELEEQLRGQTVFQTAFVERVTTEIRDLSRGPEVMTNTSRVERIISVISMISGSDQAVTQTSLENVLGVVNDIHDADATLDARVSTESKNDLVMALSSFAENVELSDNQTTFVSASSNIAVQVTKVRSDDAFVQYNSSLVTNASADGFVSVRLPVGGASSNQSASDFRVSFVSYEDDVFFPSEYRVEKVVSASVSGGDIADVLLSTPLKYITPLGATNSSNEYRFLSCSFWDFNSSSWSSEGCSLVEGSEPPQCECTHLSNFALIVRLYYIPSSLGLDLIGKIGCSLSVISFFLTSYIYIHFPKLRKSKPGPIHIHLCMCLGVAYLVFLIGSDRIYEGRVCIVVAAGMHYFLLAAWLWMFIEGIAMYRNLVVKFGSVGDKFIIKSAVVCYTIPLVTVAVTLGVTVGFFDSHTSIWYADPDNAALVESTYVHESFCWLHGYTLIAAFLGEIGVIFVVNCVIYGAVVRSITWGRQRVHSTKSKEGSRDHVIKATSVSALLGLTWIFSLPLFLSREAVLITVFSYIFSILNSLQGVAIFYLFCVRNRATRNLWWLPIKQFVKRVKPKKVSTYEVTQI